MDLLDFVGKFHPLLVHFPIALILMAFGLDLVQKFKSNRPWKDTIKLLLVVGAVSAILAVACGWLLSRGGDYGAAIVDRHAMGGYITMVGSVLSAWLYHRDSRYAFVALSLTSVALGWTAHWGATITHGSQYFRMQTSKPSQELHTAFLARIAGNTDSLADSDLDQLSVHARMIFADHCLQCHNSVKHKADLNLETEEGIRKGGESGPALMEGQPQQSELLRRVKLDRQNEESMPPEGEPLSASAVELLELWIAQGAPWADTTLKLFAEAPIWLEKPVLPDRDLAHPIDRFVDVYFDQEGTRWPKLCDDRTFIRRAYLDVVGILPSYEEVASFEQDEHPDKRSNLIDFLLGQNKDISTHWLSFWNDLLRNDYTGTGYITGGRKQITPWLFRSLAENKPYREMVRELINPSPESEGFIKGIQWRGVVNSSQSIEMQAAQNVAQSLLGTNLKCASCHNSFVNNLTLEQAYGFANVFADSSLELHQCDKPTGQHTLPSFLYPELGQVVGDSVVDRLASLADLITSEENGRFYRTFVNRIWEQLMGSGIVPSVDDMDAPPWSPALLDWLASHFIEENTDIRELIRTIMTSRAYQLETRPVKEQAEDSDQFEGPLPRRLKAEQMLDAVSMVVDPIYHGVAFSEETDTIKPLWIWHREVEFDRTVLPKPGVRYLRKQMNLPAGTLIDAHLLVTADHAYTLFLDGKEIAKSNIWHEVTKVDLTESLSSGQEHVFAASVENAGSIPNPAGFLLTLKLRYADGRHHFIESDRSWLSTDSVQGTVWQENDYVDTSWTAAHAYGRLRSSHWGRPLAFNFSDREVPPYARAALVSLDPLSKSLGRPVRENVTTQRDDEASLLQTLTLTNSDFFHQSINNGAARMSLDAESDRVIIEGVYRSILLRDPTWRERRAVMKIAKNGMDQEAVADLIWSLLLTPEFQFI